MRPLIIGILLFLIWSALSTWFFISKIYPISDSSTETVLISEAEPLTETPAVQAVLPVKPEDLTLYFDYNKAILKPVSRLDSFITESKEYLSADTTACLIIVGHTCSIGSDTYNLELGMSRAVAVQNFLTSKGLSYQCIRVSSKGEAEPAGNNSTEEGRIKNRRAELKIN